MLRKVPFVVGEIYHVYTRGVEKRTVFTCEADYERFTALLLLANSEKNIHFSNLRSKHKGESLLEMLSWMRPEHAVTDILAYALMPNHLHLVLREKQEHGISKFMQTLMTSYVMYFNAKNERSGPLFTKPFRSRHVDDNDYLRWLFAYVHLNPVGLSQPNWKKGNIDLKAASMSLRNYAYSSYLDYSFGERTQSRILNKEALPISVKNLRDAEALVSTVRNIKATP